MTVAAINHILIDDQGIARIDGTRMKVIHLIQAMSARQLTAELLLQEFPHLTLARIHAALAYYYDHQAEMDAQIQHEHAEYDAERSAAPPTPGRQKLADSGHRP